MLRFHAGVSRLLAFVLVLGLLSGCSAAAPQPTSNPATATQEPPTATPLPPSPTATETPPPPTATFTEVPPTATNTPIPTDTATPTATSTATFTPVPTSVAPDNGWGSSGNSVLVYYILLDTGGTVGCGDSAVGVGIGQTRSGDIASDVKAALQVLFANKSEYYGQLYNPVYLSNLAVENVSYSSDTGLMTVNLRGTYIRSGDDCDNTRVKAQVWNTIRQYRDVKMTNIYLNGGPFGDKVSNDK